MDSPIKRARLAPGRWEAVELLRYKAEGAAPFRDVTRQVLFDDPALACQWRYFEVAPGGYSTLERHEHLHAVLVLRGGGSCLVGETVHDIAEHDLVCVPRLAWHQFRAAAATPLGFLCVVNQTRDRPQLPAAADREAMARNPVVAKWLAEGSLPAG